jgi:hypothetical protein
MRSLFRRKIGAMDDVWLPRTELIRVERQRQLKAWMWEFGMYAVWLASVSACLLLTQNDSLSSQYAELHRHLVMDGEWEGRVHTVDDFWVFFRQMVRGPAQWFSRDSLVP